jgi:ABC-type branched-subunit amino acid transport system substrate-binding protein
MTLIRGDFMSLATRRLLLTAALATACAHAAPTDDIVIGQTTDLSSVAGGQMLDFNTGAKLYLDAVNAHGGIGGRRIKLLTVDDGYVAKAAEKNAETLAANPAVLALFGTRGSDPTDAVIKVAEREHIALIAPVNGADAVRESKVVFPVRASYKAEVDGVLKYFSVVPTDIAVVAQDDKFGRPLLLHIEQRVKEARYSNLRLVGSVVFERKATSMDPQVTKILAMKPRAVIALCNPSACGEFVKELHKRTERDKQARPAVAQLSNVDMLGQFQKVGGAGMVGNPFAQVMPDPRRPSLQISRDFQQAAKELGVEVNYRSYEGYVSAAVLVEGLRRTKTMTRQGLRDAMESLGSFSVGGIPIEYTPGRRVGSTYVELVSLDAHGRLLR